MIDMVSSQHDYWIVLLQLAIGIVYIASCMVLYQFYNCDCNIVSYLYIIIITADNYCTSSDILCHSVVIPHVYPMIL